MGWCWTWAPDAEWWEKPGCVYSGWGWESCWAKSRPGCSHDSYYCYWHPECNIGSRGTWDPTCPNPWITGNPNSTRDRFVASHWTPRRNCSMNICPSGLVACCFSDGTPEDTAHCEMMQSTSACTECGGWPAEGGTCTPDPCGPQPCCLPNAPYECAMLSPTECQEQGGTVAPAPNCEDDPCRTACCFDAIPPPYNCLDTPVKLCEHDNGRVVWGERCEEFPCEPPGACCLCRGQCVDMKQPMCATFGGEWKENVLCEHLQQWDPCPVDAERPCRAARFAVLVPDWFSGQPTRYVPMSLDSMNPHEYVRGPIDANCRTWHANVSAVHGAWSCGQWDMEKPETKTHFQLNARIDDTTGRGSFWTRYRPVCPEYLAPEEPN